MKRSSKSRRLHGKIEQNWTGYKQVINRLQLELNSLLRQIMSIRGLAIQTQKGQLGGKATLLIVV